MHEDAWQLKGAGHSYPARMWGACHSGTNSARVGGGNVAYGSLIQAFDLLLSTGMSLTCHNGQRWCT
jgi:hypothetical protein